MLLIQIHVALHQVLHYFVAVLLRQRPQPVHLVHVFLKDELEIDLGGGYMILDVDLHFYKEFLL